MKVIDIFDLNGIVDAAERVLTENRGSKIFAFYGTMGAGKTTFIQSLCKICGIEQPVTSPTFSLVNEYRNQEKGVTIFHFDFYRIELVTEALDMGYEDYFYSGDLCFIEWPEKIESLLPEGTVRVALKSLDNGKRELSYL